MRWWGWLAIGGVGAGAAALLLGGSSSSGGSDGPDPDPDPEPDEPPDDPADDNPPATGDEPLTDAKNVGAPFAQGDPDPVWPVAPSSTHKRRLEVAYRDAAGKVHGNGSRRFKASRGSGARYHAGIDLYADAGDIVLAPEDGQLVAQQNFLNTIPGKDALLVQGNQGVTFLLGEVTANSWKEFGLDIGSYVLKGQPVARVGLTSKGSHMLHFETYRWGVQKNTSWKAGQPAPKDLLDPTDYLLRALQRAKAIA